MNCFTSSQQWEYPCSLEAAVEKVLKPEKDIRERSGACVHCATNFSVQLTAKHLKIYVWQDFGPEGSPIDIEWRSQVAGRQNSMFIGPTLYHQPGAVRKLYGDKLPKEAIEPPRHLPVPVNTNFQARQGNNFDPSLAVFPMILAAL
ncbi:uncharacterized protein F4822DRAFT_433918 [Hypoxylon trugodes]|uniref:uncharacterized protein n=1 Tax=Hypoxylon trugodes TaxID=326681 RepID=UPI0021991B2D|nr:uncharacterized protein F4822DRAFT_433918 [Hypoxylon trugodes]KAI1383968.1 hypothetical protein F4822DRAFT_433918 [Hypoxylon trugodes]